MKITVISDTHERHEELGVLEGDVLIHCGDAANGFSSDETHLAALDDWFGRQRFALILVIGGNHDFALQARAAGTRPVLRHAQYLEDAALAFGGIRFYGAPWVPELAEWAYYQPADELRRRWARIPDATDVLIKHSPPLGILDQNRHGKSCGCASLGQRVKQLNPRVHCFGHIHASSGRLKLGATEFINASMVDGSYELARGPYELIV